MASTQPTAFSPARPVASLAVSPPTLLVALPTAMLLVDYVARLQPTPTPWPRQVAGRLPDRLLVDALGVRALLGHGDGLRCWLSRRLAADSPEARDWPALRAYLAGLPAGGVGDLVDYGVHNNLRYVESDSPPPNERARMLLEAADGVTGEERRLLRVQAVLADWGLPDAAEQARLVVDAPWFRHTLLTLLDAIWDAGFGAVWAERAEPLAAAVRDVPSAPPGTTPDGWVGAVTGLRLDERSRWLLDRAERVVVMPCPLLGRQVSVFDAGGTAYLLWEPADTGPRPAPESTDLGSLARLAPLATALGDGTRLAILLLLARGERPTAQQIAADLGLHASTVSRQVALLVRAGLVEVTRDGQARRHALDRAAVRRFCRTLQHALG